MEKYKIGQHFATTEEIKVKTALAGTEKVWPIGTKLFVTANNQFVFPDGKMMLLPKDTTVEGFDQDGIAKIIYEDLRRHLPFKDMMEDYDVTEKEVKDAIIEALDRLWMM